MSLQTDSCITEKFRSPGGGRSLWRGGEGRVFLTRSFGKTVQKMEFYWPKYFFLSFFVLISHPQRKFIKRRLLVLLCMFVRSQVKLHSRWKDFRVMLCVVIKMVRTKVLTAMVMKSSVFWDKTACISLKTNGLFGGTYRPHFQGRRIGQARNHY
jgi:hypothetical protein